MSATLLLVSIGLVTHSQPSAHYDVEPAIALSAAAAMMVAAKLIDMEAYSAECEALDSVTGACDPSEINRIDRWVTDQSSGTARLFSDMLLTTMLALPLGFSAVEAGLDDRPGQGRRFLDQNAVAYSAIAGTALVTEILKVGFRRPRPLVYNSTFDPETRRDKDAFMSFPSGHASLSFAAATVLSVSLLERHDGGPLPALAASLSYFGALSVAALRVAGGKHFITDILAGAVIGTGVGLAVTLAHLERGPDAVGTETRALESRHDASWGVSFGGSF